MTKEGELILALEFVTEGAHAVVPEALHRKAFVAESFQVETEKLSEKSRDWTSGRGIQGIGIGEKISKGKETGELSMRVYVERKKAASKIKNKVPKTVSVPEVGKIQTDVVEIGRLELETFTDRLRPAIPGSGVGHKDVTVGTFGCLVHKKGSKTGQYILSNSHVLANSGVADVGDEILQPGKLDGGKLSADVIATLSEFVPFDFSQGYPNLVDAAIAKVKSTRSVAPEIRIIGVKPRGVSEKLSRGMRVKKTGRTTDFTIGVIQDLHYRVRIPYRSSKIKANARRTAGLKDLVLCTRYTAGGDSGSIVLNDRNYAVGLHFAGSASTSIFCRIRNVLDQLDVELV